MTLGDGICQSIDIRNTVGYFAMMRGCRVIEGFLQIVLLENAPDKEFEDLQFPELREITGYLLLYRVHGLKSIGRLFPNLEVIRGNILLADYAFMVYEMQNLQEVSAAAHLYFRYPVEGYRLGGGGSTLPTWKNCLRNKYFFKEPPLNTGQRVVLFLKINVDPGVFATEVANICCVIFRGDGERIGSFARRP